MNNRVKKTPKSVKLERQITLVENRIDDIWQEIIDTGDYSLMGKIKPLQYRIVMLEEKLKQMLKR